MTHVCYCGSHFCTLWCHLRPPGKLAFKDSRGGGRLLCCSHTHLFTHTHWHTPIHAHTHTKTYTNSDIQTHAHIYATSHLLTGAQTHAHTKTNTCTQTCTYTRIHTHIHAPSHTLQLPTHTNIYMHTDTFMDTHIPEDTHAHVHTYAQTEAQRHKGVHAYMLKGRHMNNNCLLAKNSVIWGSDEWKQLQLRKNRGIESHNGPWFLMGFLLDTVQQKKWNIP